MTQDEPAGPVVRVNVRLTFDDFRECSRLYRRKWSEYYASIWGIECLILVGSIAAYSAITKGIHNVDMDGLAIGSFAGLVALLIISPFYTANTLRKQWNAIAAYMQVPRAYSFSPFGLQVISESEDYKTTWKNVVAAERGHSIFVLQRLDGIINIVPLRAFETEMDQRVFQQLVERLFPIVSFDPFGLRHSNVKERPSALLPDVEFNGLAAIHALETALLYAPE